MDQGNEVPHSIEKFQACDYRAAAVAVESQTELKGRGGERGGGGCSKCYIQNEYITHSHSMQWFLSDLLQVASLPSWWLFGDTGEPVQWKRRTKESSNQKNLKD